ncbi:PEP-2 [Plodia interpunctella granulovirus]|uniref:PEP-2 n=1 Tax=Plodia interpunctella granulovirus TaxID=262175 RepID=A0A1L5JGX3_9BBAC|nr:PEP-2 [Plodia interpunctella granulovirus]APO13907.1 PEP-2 [Plodia interpunctella granulovirus]
MSVVIRKFDGIDVPLFFIDMILWVGADEALKILRLPSHALFSLPDSEKNTLNHLVSCSDNRKCFITALGVGLLCSRLVNRGSVIDNLLCNDNQLPERANAFANIFLTDFIYEIRQENLLCSISKTEDTILTLLNTPVEVV